MADNRWREAVAWIVPTSSGTRLLCPRSHQVDNARGAVIRGLFALTYPVTPECDNCPRWPVTPSQGGPANHTLPLFFSPDYLSSSTRFDTLQKPGWVAALLNKRPVPGVELTAPTPLTEADLETVHDPVYVRAIRSGDDPMLVDTRTAGRPRPNRAGRRDREGTTARWAEPQGYLVDARPRDAEIYAWPVAWDDKRKGHRVRLVIGGICPNGFRKVDVPGPYLWVYTGTLENFKVKELERKALAQALRAALGADAGAGTHTV